MSFFLKSRRKLLILTVIIISLCLFQATISHFLRKSKPEITQYLNNTFGYVFKIDDVTFNLARGAHLKGVAVSYQQKEKPIFIKDVFIGIEILPLFTKKVVINKITACSTAYFLNPDTLILFKKTTILLYKAGRFKLNSLIKIASWIPQASYISRFLDEKQIIQEIRCAADGNIINDDLDIEMLLLTLHKAQFIGTGKIKNFRQKTPYFDINFIPSTISLNEIAFLKKNLKKLQGYVLLSLKLNGTPPNIKTLLDAGLDNCNFSYRLYDGEVFDIKNMRADIAYGNKSLKIKDMFFVFNSLPVNINFEDNPAEGSGMLLQLSLPYDFLSRQNLPLERLEAVFRGRVADTLQGKLEFKALYKRKGSNLEIQVNLNNLDFDYYNLGEKYLKIAKIELVKNDGIALQKLFFADLDSILNTSKDRFSIKNLTCNGYNGTIKGRMNLDLKDNVVLSIALSGEDFDMKALSGDIAPNAEPVLGTLVLKVSFNNSRKDFFRGAGLVKNGIINLDKLAEIINFPSLKNVYFEAIRFCFWVSKTKVKIGGLRLISPEVIATAFADTNHSLKGSLSAKINTEFLKKSPPFKTLINLTRIKSPYIDFKFLIGGIFKAARFIWLKGEFKHKLEKRLPNWAKKSIETRLNPAIDNLAK